MKTDPLMIYVHIPFCTRKCHYCAFVSVNNENLWKDYFEALHKEIEARKSNKTVKSIIMFFDDKTDTVPIQHGHVGGVQQGGEFNELPFWHGLVTEGRNAVQKLL